MLAGQRVPSKDHQTTSSDALLTGKWGTPGCFLLLLHVRLGHAQCAGIGRAAHSGGQGLLRRTSRIQGGCKGFEGMRIISGPEDGITVNSFLWASKTKTTTQSNNASSRSRFRLQPYMPHKSAEQSGQKASPLPLNSPGRFHPARSGRPPAPGGSTRVMIGGALQ